MRLLLDTHAVIWWFQGDTRLTLAAREAMVASAAQVHVSAVSALEIALKVRAGKLPQGAALERSFKQMLEEQSFTELAVSVEHALQAGRLAFAHRDPFDRLLIAQAITEDLTLVSNERLFDQTGVARLW